LSWDFFDRIYCITTRERPDRRAEAEAQFAAVGLSGRVAFVTVDRHPVDPEQGIYESHLRCMEKAIAAGARRLIIFEDDILFDRFDPRVLGNVVDFLSATPDWRMLLLGCMVRSSRRTGNPSVLKVAYRSLTHACALNRPFAEALSRNPWRGVPYDDTLRDLADDRTFAAYPSFAFQSDSRSDNTRYLPLDRFRRMCGGLRRLQKLDEFLNLYKQPLLMAHIAAALALAAWILS